MPFVSKCEIKPDRPTPFIATDKFFCSSRERPLHKAKRLKKEMKSRGYQIPLHIYQDAVARMYGFRSLMHFFNNVGMGEPSLGDGAIGKEAFELRFADHVKVLIEIGASRSDAEAIIDAIRPTSGGGPNKHRNDGFTENLGAPELVSEDGGAW